MIAVVEQQDGTVDREGARSVVDALVDALAQEALVGQLDYRLDLDWLDDHLLWLTPPEQLAGLEDQRLHGTLAALEAIDGVAALNRALAQLLLDGLDQGSLEDVDGGVQRIGMFATWLDWQHDWLDDPKRTVSEFTARGRLLDFAGDRLPYPDGYLQSRNGSLYFVIASAAEPDDGLPFRRRFVAALREQADAVERSHPGWGVHFTGRPAVVVEEMQAVRRDTLFTSVVAVVGVGLLTLFVFRWRSHAPLVMLALGFGVVWSFGAVYFEYGYLNMITSSFISTLVGVGVAYGIHPVSEYELAGAHRGDPLQAIRTAYRHTGGAVTVAAITTSAAFFSILLMQFRGFAELGLVAGVGVLLCWLAAMLLLPAFLSIYGRRRARRDRRERGGSAVDRWWVERAADWATRAPKTVSLLGLIATALLAWQATELRFDANLFGLLPRDAPSLRYQQRMADESDLTPLFNMTTASSLDDLRGQAARAAEEPSIAAFVSALQFLPADAAAAERAAARLRASLDALEVDPSGTADAEALVDSLMALEEALAESADSAFAAGLGELAGLLEQAREAAEERIGQAEALDAMAWRAVADAERALLAHATALLDKLRRDLTREAPRLETLPASVRARFTTDSGRLLGLLYPVGDVFEGPRLQAFTEASRRVSPEATGFPLVFQRMMGSITAGFTRAVASGGAIVLLILLVTFRSIRDALLAALPLVIGAIWMMGGMRLLGIDFNLANLVGVPLIIGVGIDNGVHIMRRVRLEGELGMDVVSRHTGRAILIASLTTMIGFGSLGLASHRGMASLGIVLLIGVAACLATSTLILPNLLIATGRVRK